MRSLTLAKNGLNKVRAQQKELKQTDIEDSLKSIPPGEWLFLKSSNSSDQWIAFVNPLIDDKYSCVQILQKASDLKNFNPEIYISQAIDKAFEKRRRFISYSESGRFFYGTVDGLPGLIIDVFKHKAVVQINTAGVDKHRKYIQKLVSEKISGEAFFLDNAKYREKEFLPTFENIPIPDLEILENDLHYKIRSQVVQKVGFYYDHRENRNQLVHHIGRLLKKPKKGVDLFCYVGAWGLNALKAGVDKIDFVDQGDFSEEIKESLKLNKMDDHGQFHRQDVFKFLDEAISKNTKFDLVLCDPPAFAKSSAQKDQALEGYSKLHRKALKVATPGALLAFSSCTHYVSHDEFQKNILDAAQKEGCKLQLIFCGMQGWDHPVTSLMDKSNYIKSYFYLME